MENYQELLNQLNVRKTSFNSPSSPTKLRCNLGFSSSTQAKEEGKPVTIDILPQRPAALSLRARRHLGRQRRLDKAQEQRRQPLRPQFLPRWNTIPGHGRYLRRKFAPESGGIRGTWGRVSTHHQERRGRRKRDRIGSSTGGRSRARSAGPKQIPEAGA